MTPRIAVLCLFSERLVLTNYTKCGICVSGICCNCSTCRLVDSVRIPFGMFLSLSSDIFQCFGQSGLYIVIDVFEQIEDDGNSAQQGHAECLEHDELYGVHQSVLE